MSTFRNVKGVLVVTPVGLGDGFRSFRGAGRTFELPWSLPNATSHAASFDPVRTHSNDRPRKPLEIIALKMAIWCITSQMSSSAETRLVAS